MKYVNSVVFMIVAAAVLLAAFAIGLLIRQARTRRVESHPQAVAAPNEAFATQQRPEENYGPGQRRKQSTDPQERARIKQERAETLEKMSNLTEEEKQQFRERTRNRFRPTAGRSAEARERMLREFENMSEEEKKAYRAQIEAKLRARRERRLEEAAGVPEKVVTNEPNVEKIASEPNEGDPK